MMTIETPTQRSETLNLELSRLPNQSQVNSYNIIDHFSVFDCSLYVGFGEIKTRDYDAIVCKARPSLAYDNDGVFSNRVVFGAGSSVTTEIQTKHRLGCSPGMAVLTGGGLSGARHLIHAVTPTTNINLRGELQLWESLYGNCMQLAYSCGARTMLIPHLGENLRCPNCEMVATVAIETAISYMRRPHHLNKIVFILPDSECAGIYSNALFKAAAQESHGA